MLMTITTNKDYIIESSILSGYLRMSGWREMKEKTYSDFFHTAWRKNEHVVSFSNNACICHAFSCIAGVQGMRISELLDELSYRTNVFLQIPKQEFATI